ncbi:MAG: NAD-dependent epimerase/dehydratase family protein [Pseudomonadota bacterium]
MRTLLLGATGYIGSAVLEHLMARGHSVVALARSDGVARRLANKGIRPLPGDLRNPAGWVLAVHEVDAVIQLAATFSDDMGQVDRRAMEAIAAEAASAGRPIRVIYTGGCWLYGATGDAVASEESAFDPIDAFAWMVQNGSALMGAPGVEGVVIHPAMVYDRDGGAVARFIADARTGGPIEVFGALNTRWPMVHREDLATAYGLALEKGVAGQSYNVATEPGVRVGDIVDVVARRFGVTAAPRVRSVPELVADFGDWAAGPALDQQMSGRKIADELGWRPLKTQALAELA